MSRSTPAAQLLESGVCGPGGLPSTELAHLVDRIVSGDRAHVAGLPPLRDHSRPKVLAALKDVWGCDIRAPGINPEHTLRAATTAATVLARHAAGGAPVALATAAPASLLPLHLRLARLARAVGAPVAENGDSGPLRVDGRRARRLRFLDGVAVVTDGEHLYATRGPDVADEWLSTLPRPAVVVADGPFVLGALHRGIPVIAFADLRALAVGMVASEQANAVVVPVHVGPSPAAYAPLLDAIDGAFAAAVSGTTLSQDPRRPQTPS